MTGSQSSVKGGANGRRGETNGQRNGIDPAQGMWNQQAKTGYGSQ